jgi:hypothetical protein
MCRFSWKNRYFSFLAGIREYLYMMRRCFILFISCMATTLLMTKERRVWWNYSNYCIFCEKIRGNECRKVWGSYWYDFGIIMGLTPLIRLGPLPELVVPGPWCGFWRRDVRG